MRNKITHWAELNLFEEHETKQLDKSKVYMSRTERVKTCSWPKFFSFEQEQCIPNHGLAIDRGNVDFIITS